MKHTVPTISNPMRAGLALCIALVGVSCTASPLRTEASTSGIRAAEEVGAAGVPQASLHLQMAKESLAKAQKLAKNGEKAQADSLLMRAEADAELAVALSREDAEKSEASAAVQRVRDLLNENK
jgi:hypothetical protein